MYFAKEFYYHINDFVLEPLSVTFENPATEAKIRIFFYLPQKTLLVNYFQK